MKNQDWDVALWSFPCLTFLYLWVLLSPAVQAQVILNIITDKYTKIYTVEYYSAIKRNWVYFAGNVAIILATQETKAGSVSPSSKDCTKFCVNLELQHFYRYEHVMPKSPGPQRSLRSQFQYKHLRVFIMSLQTRTLTVTIAMGQKLEPQV